MLAVFAFSAAAQIGLPTWILTGLLGLVVAAAAITLALAFGLEGRAPRRRSAPRARCATRWRRPDDHRRRRAGRITAIESTATVLDPGDGSTVRVPNGMLLDAVVVIHDDADHS